MLSDLHYTVATHFPLLQGEMPCICVMRNSGDEARIIKVIEVNGREFNGDVMQRVADMAVGLCELEKETSIRAHLVYSGKAFGHVEIDDLLSSTWPQESYSYVTVPMGADRPMLQREEESLPLNHYVVPRISLISAINYAYASPGRVYLGLPNDQAANLTSQMAAFTERASRVSANDPDAILEYQGEGRVMCFAVCLWHHFHAPRVRANWARDMLS